MPEPDPPSDRPPLSPPVPPLDAHLGYWLRLVANHVSQHFARAIAEHGVTIAEWVLLRELFDAGAVAPSVLAAKAGLTRGAVTKLVDRLRAKRLVVRATGSGDRRYQTIALTGAGARLVPTLADVADRDDQAMFGALPPDTRALLEGVLRDLAGRGTLAAHPID